MTIDESAFSHCSNLSSIVIPDSVSHIGQYAFSNCDKILQEDNGIYYVNGWVVNSNKKVTVADISNARGISESALAGCADLEKVYMPDSINGIGSHAFLGCENLSYVIIPNGVTAIDEYTFKSCYRLDSIMIPEGVTSIGEAAFMYCSNMKSILIPNSVVFIGDNAFDSCRELSGVYFSGTEEEWAEITIGTDNECLASATIYFNYEP